MLLKGTCVSPGTVLAPARVVRGDAVTVARTARGEMTAEEAAKKIETAAAKARGELDELIGISAGNGSGQADIFAAQQAILQDEELAEMIKSRITDGETPEYAVYASYNEFIKILSGAGDENIALRAGDVRDVRNRLLRSMGVAQEEDVEKTEADAILVAHDLLPSEMIARTGIHTRGLVLEEGGATSHTAILARSMGIPTLAGVKDVLSAARSGDLLLLDASAGTLIVRPDGEEQIQGRKKQDRWKREEEAMKKYMAEEASTADGDPVKIGLNIGAGEEEIPASADFVGLLRTEFLYMNSDHLPTEEEQFCAYRGVMERAKGRPVTLRTLDIGGDKKLPYLPLPKEENPFLGMRALRLCFERKDIFITQLCAALRASAFGKMKIMFPMVGSMDDYYRARDCAEEAKTILRRRNEPFDEKIPFGIMIEIPSMAMIADIAAREVDFASVGTNDLCQYVCAADRMDARLGAYSQPLSPAMVRLLGFVISSFRAAGKDISLCGELAGDTRATALLTGMGLRQFSMSAACIPAVKAALRKITVCGAEEIYQQALQCNIQADILRLCQNEGQ